MHKDQWITVTTSTDQSPSETTGRSDGQEIFGLQLNAFHFHVRETTNAGPYPGLNPRLYILRLLRFILILLCNAHLRFQNDLVSSIFHLKFYMHLFYFPHLVLLGLFPWQYFLTSTPYAACHSALFSGLPLLLYIWFIILSSAPNSQTRAAVWIVNHTFSSRCMEGVAVLGWGECTIEYDVGGVRLRCFSMHCEIGEWWERKL